MCRSRPHGGRDLRSSINRILMSVWQLTTPIEYSLTTPPEQLSGSTHSAPSVVWQWNRVSADDAPWAMCMFIGTVLWVVENFQPTINFQGKHFTCDYEKWSLCIWYSVELQKLISSMIIQVKPCCVGRALYIRLPDLATFLCVSLLNLVRRWRQIFETAEDLFLWWLIWCYKLFRVLDRNDWQSWF